MTAPAPAERGARAARDRRVDQDGRAKAYRPLPADERTAAREAGLAAYARGDFFAAHEHLEPAWMGSADAAERSLDQGLIKLAAAYVHAVRGNPAGWRKNLEGARSRLAAGAPAAAAAGVALDNLLAAIDERLARSVPGAPGQPLDPPTIRRTSP